MNQMPLRALALVLICIVQAPLIRIGSNRYPVPASVQVIDKIPCDMWQILQRKRYEYT